jgi:hypothetical protein
MHRLSSVDGLPVGCKVGAADGKAVGKRVGKSVGDILGSSDGATEGWPDVGSSAGLIVCHVLSYSSINVGRTACSIVGHSEGETDRFCISAGRYVATEKGTRVVGAAVEGPSVGDNMTLVGEKVGAYNG